MGTPPESGILSAFRARTRAGGGAKLTPDRGDITGGEGRPENQAIVVLKADKKDIKTYKELAERITSHKAGDALPLTVRRDKETLEMTAHAGQSSRLPIDAAHKNATLELMVRRSAGKRPGPARAGRRDTAASTNRPTAAN